MVIETILLILLLYKASILELQKLQSHQNLETSQAKHSSL